MRGGVFVSHASADAATAHLVVEVLEAAEVPCWIAPRDIAPGTDYTRAILDGLEEAPLVVLLFSEVANESPHVLRELETAVGARKWIVPVRLDTAEMSRSFRYLVGTAQWLDADRDNGRGWLDSLVHAVQRGSQEVPAPISAHTPARLRPHAVVERPLVGRGRELEEITERLQAGRILTLTGPGGSGKTSLATAVAAASDDEYRDGVFVVSLANVRDPDLVMPEIAQAAGVPERAGVSALAALQHFFVDKSALLVLDNVEQVIDSAPLISELASACPHLALMVTSRARLRIAREEEYQVPPLGLPDDRAIGSADVAMLQRSDAVALFVDRARAARPGFELTNQNAEAVAQVCIGLDGLPLAIELAAARTRMLNPSELLARLDQRLKILTGGGRDAPARQQTLRNTLDWSLDLLDESEQHLFRRLAVFVGGWTIEAAESVCHLDTELDVDVLDGLVSLADNSLVRHAETAGRPRFSMLQVVREYAMEKLADDSAAAAIHTRHADYFSDLAFAVAADLETGSELEVAAQLSPDLENLTAAVTCLSSDHQVERALAVLDEIWFLWASLGRLREGEEIFEQMLPAPRTITTILEASTATSLGEYYRFQGRFNEAREVIVSALPVLRRHAPTRVAATLRDLAQVHQQLGELDEARELMNESLSLRRAQGDAGGIAHTLWAMARLDLETGDLEEAEAKYTEVARLGAETGMDDGVWSAEVGLATIAEHRGEADRAEGLYRRVLDRGSVAWDPYTVSECLAGLANTAAALGRPRRAARLLGIVDAFLESTGQVLFYPDQRDRRHHELLAALGRAQIDTAIAAGRAMTPAEAIAYAVSEDDD